MKNEKLREFLKENLPELLEESLKSGMLDSPYSYWASTLGFGRDDLEEVIERGKKFSRCVEPVISDYIKENYIECEDCGALIAKDKAKVVVIKNTLGEEDFYYCSRCKPAYDRVAIEYKDGGDLIDNNDIEFTDDSSTRWGDLDWETCEIKVKIVGDNK